MNNFGLYVIITKPLLTYSKIAELCVKHEIRYLQLREKDLSDQILLNIAKEISSITKYSKTRFIINDRVDICLLADADGVHLGQDDIAFDEARKLLGPDKIIGLSSHNLIQAKIAFNKNPDYIGFGPIYKTPTKKIPDPVLGLNPIKELIHLQKELQTTCPFVAIGGIDDQNYEDVLMSGTKNLSMVRYLMETDMFEERITKIKQKIMESW